MNGLNRKIKKKIKVMEIKELKQDEKNYRKHSDKNKKLIKKSIAECGYGRSVLIDADGVLIAGNGVHSVSDKDTKVRVVETDGTELVVVKRTDLHTGDERRKKLAKADNATADRVEWDFDNLLDDFDAKELEQFGIRLPKETEKLSKLEFREVYYEPKDKPNITLSDCVDTSKFDAKIKAIDECDLTYKQKEMLKIFAYRFIRIDFETVANYYAFCANDEEKKAIERLRLVLVDNGINGFIEDDMLRLYEQLNDLENDE